MTKCPRCKGDVLTWRTGDMQCVEEDFECTPEETPNIFQTGKIIMCMPPLQVRDFHVILNQKEKVAKIRIDPINKVRTALHVLEKINFFVQDQTEVFFLKNITLKNLTEAEDGYAVLTIPLEDTIVAHL